MTHRHFQKSLACLALSLLVESVSGQLTSPAAGIVRRRDGTLQRVDGVSGNYILGPVVSDGATLASTFDARGGLVQLEAAIAVVDASGRESARFETGSRGRAVLGGRYAFFEADRTLWGYGDAATALALGPFEGTVVAIGESPAALALAVRRDDGLWRLAVAEDGSIVSQDPLPGTAQSLVLLQAARIWFSDGNNVVCVDLATRTEKRWTFDADATALAAMSGSTVQVTTSTGLFAIRPDRDRVTQIPEADLAVSQ